jgi:hypothetical protein
MDELDLGGVPPSLDDRSDAIFDASLILAIQRHGLTSYLPTRAAPAGAEEEDEDEGPETEDDSERGALVVGAARQRSACKRRKPSQLVDLSSFEADLKRHLTNDANPRMKCNADKADQKLRDLRRAVGRARGMKMSKRDAPPPVSAPDLAALFNTEPVMEHLETVARDRAKKLLGTIICALIRNRDTPEAVVADESAVADGRSTCQDLIDFYLEHHRVAKHAVSNSKEPSRAQTEGWVPWPVLAETAVDLSTQVTLDIEARERDDTQVFDAAQLDRLLALGIMSLGVLFVPARYFEVKNMWLTQAAKKDADYAAKNWVHWAPGTSGVDDTFDIVYNVHKGKDSGFLGVVTTSPTQACFGSFRAAFRLYVAQLRQVAGLPGDTSIPLFFDAKAFVKQRILRPMNEDQLAAMYFAVTERYVGKRIGCKMLRTIFSSYHALGLEANATGHYPARDLTIKEVARAMLHSYNVHMDYYIREVPI